MTLKYQDCPRSFMWIQSNHMSLKPRKITGSQKRQCRVGSQRVKCEQEGGHSWVLKNYPRGYAKVLSLMCVCACAWGTAEDSTVAVSCVPIYILKEINLHIIFTIHLQLPTDSTNTISPEVLITTSCHLCEKNSHNYLFTFHMNLDNLSFLELWSIRDNAFVSIIGSGCRQKVNKRIRN